VSRTFERYFGVRQAELAGRDLRQLLASRLGRALAEPEAVTAVLTGRGDAEARIFDCRVLPGADRQERWLESWSQPIRSGRHAGGRIDYYYDVTERKRAEEAARRSEDQLVQAQKMEAVGRLAGGLAHDFNNLLTAINGYTDLIIRLTDDDRLKTYVGEIKKAGDRAADLTAKLLALSKPPPSLRRIADLNQVVPNLEGLLRRLIGEDVELETRLSAELRLVRIDPGQLEQVLLNLAVNARDAMPTGGRLVVESTSVDPGVAGPLGIDAERHVCVRVSDTGAGIDADVREHIFEPFFTTKQEGKGTGLGLSTVYAAVTQNQGQITVDSAPGSGTTFSIYLPSAEGEVEPGPVGRTTAAPGRGSEQILLVEDDASVRKLVTELLEQLGYEVNAAEHAAHALELIEDLDREVELLVTDVVMPGMSGPDLANRLARRFPRMKILFISGYTDSLVLRHGLLDAEHVMLQKPFDGRMLAAKVRDLLDQPG
jgi:two-component system, cell cycle sensor histidine kinase and response regulator CckA